MATSTIPSRDIPQGISLAEWWRREEYRETHEPIPLRPRLTPAAKGFLVAIEEERNLSRLTWFHSNSCPVCRLCCSSHEDLRVHLLTHRGGKSDERCG
jgi:hypothetical protein